MVKILSSVINTKNLRDTTLWIKLNQGFSGKDKDVAYILSNNLIQICQKSSERMKIFSSFHPQFTLHDETHFLRVTELMAMIIPNDVLNDLNPIELALLILSAHYHDQGMVLDKEEFEALKEDDSFKLHEINWSIEHPNYKEIVNQLVSPNISQSEKWRLLEKEKELQSALLTDYIRTTHGKRSADYVIGNFSDNDLWNIAGTNLASYVAKICQSHVLPASDITPRKNFFHDESIGGYQVNIIYLAIVLRLADILDFDRDRTPDILYKTIHFSNEVSLLEWAKHRTVEGWLINSNQIRFTHICEHPVYEKAVRQFMDWIDNELFETSLILKDFPTAVQNYYLNLPQKVDRSRIQAKENSYIYHDLEFSLSRNEIVKLLMTDNLYKSPSLCIRELLQNSLDALRHRKALIKSDNGSDWSSGMVRFTHTLDEYNREVIECIDNGIGMDIDIITRFLTKAGRSYYRSPEFNQERVSFVEHNVDFDPCAQFGIGFMSCFMLGDEIVIKTRKDYGSSKGGHGKPLIVEINGLSGIIVVREGEITQEVGTSVKIISRQKPEYFDLWEDRVRLIDVLDGYALATEFPISGVCDILEIKDSIQVPVHISKNLTLFENLLATNYVTFEQDFNEINQDLYGQVRASFLLDEEGKISFKNSEASFGNGNSGFTTLCLENNGEHHFIADNNSSTCIDGILVCGSPGRSRTRSSSRLGWNSNILSLGTDSFTIDIRGSIKPFLTTERIPPSNLIGYGGINDFKWNRIQQLASLTHGRLWGKVINRLYDESNNGDVFWNLVSIYEPDLFSFNYSELFNKVYFPIIDDKGNIVRWNTANEIDNLIIKNTEDSFKLQLNDGNFVGTYTGLDNFKSKNSGFDVDWIMKLLIVSMAVLVENEDGLSLEIREPNDLETAPRQNWITRPTPIIQYSSNLNDVLAASLAFKTINANHPLVKFLLPTSNLIELNALQTFAQNIVFNMRVEDLKDNDFTPWKRRLGFYYKSVDWSNVDNNLKPPYKFLDLNGNQFELTEYDFIKWTEIPLQKFY